MNSHRAILWGITLGLALSSAPALAQQAPVELRTPGAAVDSVVPDVHDRATASTVTELVRGRAPGLNVMESSGAAGASPRLWIRGPQSIFLRNDPLVVVDGVRIISDPSAFAIEREGQSTSRLADLSPEEIASVRVLRGPAGAAAYGPEGAAGVLEITTRAGAPGRAGPAVHAWSTLGVRQQATDFPANFGRAGTLGTTTLATPRCTIYMEAGGLCVPSAEAVSFNPLEENSPFRDGLVAGAGVRVSGSGRGLLRTYGLSAGTETVEGTLRDNAHGLHHLRGSVALGRSNTRLFVTAAHARRTTDLPVPSVLSGAPIGAGLRGSATDDENGGYAPGLLGPDEYRLREEVGRTMVGTALEWSPLPWLVLGADASRDHAAEQATRRSTVDTDVSVAVDQGRTRWQLGAHATVRGAARGVNGALTAGAQRLGNAWRRDERVLDSPVPGLDSSVRSDDEVNALFARGLVDWGPLTLGGTVRQDEVEFQPADRLSYSAGGEWTLVSARGASGTVNHVALRAAHGRSERGVEALAFWRGVDICHTDCSAPDPEVWTETEAGVDLALFSRLDLAFTAYTRETSGVLASAGALPATRRVTNRGWEASASLRGADEGRARWRVDATAAANRNRFEAPFGVTAGRYVEHQDGHELGAYLVAPITGFADGDGDGVLSCRTRELCEVQVSQQLAYGGSPMPDLVGSLGGTLGLGAVSLYARVDGQSGAELLDLTRATRCVSARNCEAAYDPGTPLQEQAGIVAVGLGSFAGFVHDADFVRLREVALTLSAPSGWAARLGGAQVDLTVAGRNLAVWTDYPGLDPETSAAGPSLFNVTDAFEQPLARTITTRIDVRF